MEPDEKSALTQLDERLRQLEADGQRDSEEFGRLSKEREGLLNSVDDDS